MSAGARAAMAAPVHTAPWGGVGPEAGGGWPHGRRPMGWPAGADSWRAMAGRAAGAQGRGPVAGVRAGPHGWRAMPGPWAVMERRAGRAGMRQGAYGRAVMPWRGRRPEAGVIMPVRGYPQRREDREDVRRGIIRADAQASGIEAVGRNGKAAADGGAVIVVGTADEGRAEQGGAEQGGKALHGRLLAKRREGQNISAVSAQSIEGSAKKGKRSFVTVKPVCFQWLAACVLQSAAAHASQCCGKRQACQSRSARASRIRHTPQTSAEVG